MKPQARRDEPLVVYEAWQGCAWVVAAVLVLLSAVVLFAVVLPLVAM